MLKKSIMILLSFVLLFVSVSFSAPKQLKCDDCGQINDKTSKFCIKCGASLSEEKARLAKSDTTEISWQKRYMTGILVPSRLFTAQKADVIGPMDINLSAGGMFGIETSRRFVGNIGIGLGGIAEIELSSSEFLNQLIVGSTTLPSSVFKMKIISENFNNMKFIPATSASLKITRWNKIESTDETAFASSAKEANIYEFNFESMYAMASLIISKRFINNSVGIHTGLIMTDARINKNSPHYVSFAGVGQDTIKVVQESFYSPFLGAEIKVNPKTTTIIEYDQLLTYNYDFNKDGTAKKGTFKPRMVWMVAWGVRYSFIDWLSIDGGAKYQSGSVGIADAEIRLSFNLIIPVLRIAQAQREKNLN